MEFYTKLELAKLFKIHPKTVQRWLQKGEIKGIKLGKGRTALIRIPKEEVEKFLKKNQIKHG